MSHTPEYYESQIERRDREIAQLRETLTFYVSTKKRDVGMELLRAELNRWIGVAERLVEHDCPNSWQAALKIYYEAVSDTHEKVMKGV